MIKVSAGPIFPIKSYKSLWLKNGPIKTYEVLYFCLFGIVNLYFHQSNEESSYKHARSVEKLLAPQTESSPTKLVGS